MTKKSFYGRSMVEMLGVLAIIGVLSIAGMWGYQKAMTLYRTNNLIEDVRLAGFVVMDSLFDILPDDDIGMDMAGLFDQKTPYQYTAFAEKENTFEIMAQDIPYPVCEEVKKRKVEWLEEIKANGIPNICNKDDINAVSFFFNTELNGNTEQESEQCRTDDDCQENEVCANDHCLCDTGFASDTGSAPCERCLSGQGNLTLGSTYCYCTENAHCHEDEYCHFAIGNYNTKGRCQKWQKNNTVTFTIGDKSFRGLRTGMNWWTAMNWCNAQPGYRPVSKNDVCQDTTPYEALIQNMCNNTNGITYTSTGNKGWWGDLIWGIRCNTNTCVSNIGKEYKTYGLYPLCVKE